LVSLGLNIAALIVPFMSLKIMNGKPQTYSVPHTVKKMWDDELKWIAILIAIFSITYPFVKLIGMTVVWFFQPFGGKFCERYLSIMTQIGRWSLLDVYVALILVALADGQKAFSVTLHSGLPLFLCAIMISMTVGEMMLHRQRITNEEENAQNDLLGDLEELTANLVPAALEESQHLDPNVTYRHVVHHWIVRILSFVTLAFTVTALMTNYLQITMIFFKQNHFCVLTAMRALFDMGEWGFALLMIVLLIIAPIAYLICNFIL